MGVVAENFEELGNIAKAFQSGTTANTFTSTTFQRKEKNAPTSKIVTEALTQNVNVKNRFETTTTHAKKVGGRGEGGGAAGGKGGGEKKRKPKVERKSDEELAREMQRQYDREVEFASRIEKKQKKGQTTEKAKLTGFFKRL